MHSFISFDLAHELNLPVSDLPYVLVVSILVDEFVKTSQACLQCPFKISNRTFIVDLICLPLSGIDMILGMDWLSANYVMLNCFTKFVVLHPVLVESITPAHLYLSSLELEHGKTKNQGYILFMASKVEVEQTLSEIPMVREYLNVFQEDIPGFPLKREVEFSIDLMPGIGPISIVPYRMSPLELTRYGHYEFTVMSF